MDISGENINWSYLQDCYLGKDDDKPVSIQKIKLYIHFIMKVNFPVKRVLPPSSKDVILIKSNTPKPKWTVSWEDNLKNDYNEAGITLPTQRKIFITYPLPTELSSLQVITHELGHWYFDRLFDKYFTKIPRDGSRYIKYSHAISYFFEELFTKKRRDLTGIQWYADMQYNRDGQEIFVDFKDKMLNTQYLIPRVVYWKYKKICEKNYPLKECP